MLGDQNAAMRGLSLQLKAVTHPVDSCRWVGLVNTDADAAAKVGTRYTVQEREFFRMAVSSTERV